MILLIYYIFIFIIQNELDILKWQERIQSMKKDPGTARIYLSSKPTFYREVPTDTEPADESNKETPLTKTFIQIEPAISYTSLVQVFMKSRCLFFLILVVSFLVFLIAKAPQGYRLIQSSKNWKNLDIGLRSGEEMYVV